ncbi:MAG: TATA-box-binding protein [Candidatus Lokiarchaeota archaeon]|nr:TATA-box-binding protein [Candidatus Lokiarchaeota archaeon]
MSEEEFDEEDKEELEEEGEEGEEGEYDYKTDLDYKIENVVATVVVEITEKIDLNQIARRHAEVEYNPERFPGLVMRIEKPRATILIFSTGKMVVTGLRQASEADRVVDKVVKNIKKAGIKVTNPEITIQNIVASGDLHTNIDLNMAAIVMEYAMYEPEVFPGLIYRMQEPKTVFLIFSTGRIVCTGAKRKEIVRDAVLKLNQQVRELGVAKKDIGRFRISRYNFYLIYFLYFVNPLNE